MEGVNKMCRENDLLVKKDHNIIVIDDDETTLKIIKEIMDKSLPKSSVEYFSEVSPQFCRYVTKKDIDLYVMDVRLKDLDARTLTEKIIDAEQGSIFLFISGYDFTMESFSNLTGKCIYDFMAKPFDTKGFIASVVALLNISITYNLFKQTIYNVDSARAHYAEIIKKDKEMIKCLQKDFLAECIPNF